MANTGKDKKLATFNIEAEVWQAFQAKARENGYSAAGLLKEWIGDYLGRAGVLPIAEKAGGVYLDDSQRQQIEEKGRLHLTDSQRQQIVEALAPRVVDELVPQVTAAVEFRLPDSIDMYLEKNLGSRLEKIGGQSLGESERLGETEALRRELEEARAEIESLRSQNAELEAESARESGKAREVDLKFQDAIGEVTALKAEIEKLRLQLSQQPAAQPAASIPDYSDLADRALASLKLGKQAPGYKSAAKAIARFVELLSQSTEQSTE